VHPSDPFALQNVYSKSCMHCVAMASNSTILVGKQHKKQSGHSTLAWHKKSYKLGEHVMLKGGKGERWPQ